MPGALYDYYFGEFWGDNLIPYIENGTVAESRLDDAVRSVPGTHQNARNSFDDPTGHPHPHTLDCVWAS